MSEKVKDFMEVPQQFARDGNQVCYCGCITIGGRTEVYCN